MMGEIEVKCFVDCFSYKNPEKLMSKKLKPHFSSSDFEGPQDA